MWLRFFIVFFFTFNSMAAYTPVTEVSGSVSVNNLPAVQQVSGTVNTNLLQPLTNTQLRSAPVAVTGSVSTTIDTAGLATSNNQVSQTNILSSIDSKLTSPLSILGNVSSTILNFPSLQNVSVTNQISGYATSANQNTANTYLNNIQSYTGNTSSYLSQVVSGTELRNYVTNFPSIFNTGLTQPLTDAQLRASEVPVSISKGVNVSNTVTVTGSVGIAGTVAITAASPIAVSAGTVAITSANTLSVSAGTITANLGTLNGAATSANQSTANSFLSDIDSNVLQLTLGTGTSGTPSPSYGYSVLGFDGTNSRNIKTDSVGILQTNITNSSIIVSPTGTAAVFFPSVPVVSAGTVAITASSPLAVSTGTVAITAASLPTHGVTQAGTWNAPSGTTQVAGSVSVLNSLGIASGTITSITNTVGVSAGTVAITAANTLGVSAGQVTVLQGTSPWTVSGSLTNNGGTVSTTGTIPVFYPSTPVVSAGQVTVVFNGTQSVSSVGTVPTSGTVIFNGTQPVSATISNTINVNTHAVTQSGNWSQSILNSLGIASGTITSITNTVGVSAGTVAITAASPLSVSAGTVAITSASPLSVSAGTVAITGSTGRTWTLASGTDSVSATIGNLIQVSGTVSANPSGTYTVAYAATPTVSAGQVTVNQGTNPWTVSGSVSLNGTQPVSATIGNVVSVGTHAVTQSGSWSQTVLNSLGIASGTITSITNTVGVSAGTVAITAASPLSVSAGTVTISPLTNSSIVKSQLQDNSGNAITTGATSGTTTATGYLNSIGEGFYTTTPPTLANGSLSPFQINQNSVLMVSPTGTVPITGSITATNPSVGTTGSSVPGSATYIAGILNGNLTGVSLTTTGVLVTSGTGTNTVAFASTPSVSTGTVTTTRTWTLSSATDTVSGAISLNGTQPVSATVGNAITVASGTIQLTNSSASIGKATATGYAINSSTPIVMPITSIDPSNTTTVALGTSPANNTFTGSWVDVSNYTNVTILVSSDQSSAIDGLKIQQSNNNSTSQSQDVYTIPANAGQDYSAQLVGQYYRVIYVNGAVSQTQFALQAKLHTSHPKDSSVRIADNQTDQSDVPIIKSVTAYMNGTNTANVSTSNPFPVSGTVFNNGGTVSTTGVISTWETPQSGSTNSLSNSDNVNVPKAAVKASAGRLYSLSCYNGNATTLYLMIFNSATQPAQNTAYGMTPLVVPTNSNCSQDFTVFGKYMSSGIYIGMSTSATAWVNTTGSSQTVMSIQYQ